jgi:hypothetical protein
MVFSNTFPVNGLAEVLMGCAGGLCAEYQRLS